MNCAKCKTAMILRHVHCRDCKEICYIYECSNCGIVVSPNLMLLRDESKPEVKHGR